MNTTEIQRLAAMTYPLPNEIWRPVVGYEQTYLVSSNGRVLSVPRPTTPGGILVGHADNHGYPRVALVQNGIQRSRRVHVLLMEAFVGPKPEGHEIRHIDGIKVHCTLSNLAYGTHAENMEDRTRHRLEKQGRRTHCSQGHEYTPDNTYEYAGSLICQTCRRQRRRKTEVAA